MACLRPRHALSYRVLVSTGGFQRGTLEAVNPDGSMCVALVGGGRRWCSAAEVAFVPIGGGSALGNTGLGRSSAPAGSHPESGVLLGVLPSGSAAAGAHALFSAARAALAPANAGGDDGGRPVWLPSAVTLEGGQARLQTGQRKEWRVGQPAAADGDGDDEEVRTEEGEEGWRPAADRLVAPLLSRLRGAQPRALPLGSEVYALTGAWEEAFVESQEDEFYLVRERSGALRWVIAGETAWYDVSPQPFDLSVGKALIAWDARCAQFQAAVLVHEESSRGASSGGGKWIVRYDDGDEASVDVSLMRDRWQLHLRVLCLWGDYYPARVVEALGGLIRVDHGGGHVRWSLPEQTLQKEPPEIHDLIPGAFVAVRLGARTGGREPLGAPGATSPRAAASSDAASNVFRRALLESCDPSGEAELLLDDGSRVSAPIRNVRLPQPENARVPEGTEVYSLFGEWYAGVVPSESLADETINGRFQLSLFHDRGRWTTYASRREMVQADGGSSEPGSALWRLRKGAPLCVRPPAHSGGGGGDADVGGGGKGSRRWVEALLVGKPVGTSGVLEVMLASGDKMRLPARDVRARSGEGHPVARSKAEQVQRVLRYNTRAATTIQRLARARFARRRVENERERADRRRAGAVPGRRRSGGGGGPQGSVGRGSARVGGGEASLRQGKALQQQQGGGGGAGAAKPVAQLRLLEGLIGGDVEDGGALDSVRSEEERKARDRVERERAEAEAEAKRALTAVLEETGALSAQLDKLKRQAKAEVRKDEELDAEIVEVEAALVPPPPDVAELRKTIEQLSSQRDHLLALSRKTAEGPEGLVREQEKVAQAVAELEALRAKLDGMSTELKQATKDINMTRKGIEMEKSLGDAERVQQYYETYVSNLNETARREKEKFDQFDVSRKRSSDEWSAWLALLSATARRLQAKSDAGDEAARRILGALAGGGAPSDEAAHGSAHATDSAEGSTSARTSDAKMAHVMIDATSRSNSAIDAHRSRLKELAVIEKECEEKLQKFTQKIAAHQNLSARGTAADQVSSAASAASVAMQLNRKLSVRRRPKEGLALPAASARTLAPEDGAERKAAADATVDGAAPDPVRASDNTGPTSLPTIKS